MNTGAKLVPDARPGAGPVAGTGPPYRHELGRAVTAAFLGDARAAAGLLAERGIPGRPARFAPGRTLVVVAYQEFTASPVGPYAQVSVSLPVHAPAARRRAGVPPGARPEAPVRAPLLLPLLVQSLWNTERVFRDLHFYVAAIPVTVPGAVSYSGDIWGEPAWLAGIAAGPGRAPGWLAVEVREAREARQARDARETRDSGGALFLRLDARTGGLRVNERRGYRLLSRLATAGAAGAAGPTAAGTVLADVMRVEAPGRLGFGPGRARLELGPDPRAESLRAVLGPCPVSIQTLAHKAGTVSFGGPRPWGQGEGVTPLGG